MQGPQYTLSFLHRMSQVWKEEHLAAFVASSPVWSGAPAAMAAYLSGIISEGGANVTNGLVKQASDGRATPPATAGSRPLACPRVPAPAPPPTHVPPPSALGSWHAPARHSCGPSRAPCAVLSLERWTGRRSRRGRGSRASGAAHASRRAPPPGPQGTNRTVCWTRDDELAVLSAPKARVRRDGETTEVGVSEVVADDVLVATQGRNYTAFDLGELLGKLGVSDTAAAEYDYLAHEARPRLDLPTSSPPPPPPPHLPRNLHPSRSPTSAASRRPASTRWSRTAWARPPPAASPSPITT